MYFARALFATSALGFALAQGQSVADRGPAFEAASVKAMPPLAGGNTNNSATRINNAMRIKGGPGTDDPGRIDYSGVTMQRLLTIAYAVQKSRISGPGWLDSERFSVQATLPAGASQEQFPRMLRNLLAERFKLVLHTETREISAYVLTVGTGGAKLKTTGFAAPPAADKDGFPDMNFPADFQIPEGRAMFLQEGGHARWTGHQISVPRLIETMAANLDRPLVDLTELHENYDFNIYAKFPEDLDRDEVFSVAYGKLMEQLGLKLKTRKQPVEVLVVDQADKVPTGN